MQVAEELNTTGAYALLRHPLYVANALMWSGVLLRPAIWWLWLVGILLFVLLYERIMLAEEAFLLRRFGDRFREWAQRVPAILPRWRQYQPFVLRFQWRAVARREYSTWLAAVASLATVEALLRWRQTGELGLPTPWWYALVCVALLTVVLRFLKHHTRVLQTES
jgi:hypothetical protein